MNALKHGNRSRKVALLREESCAFEERLRKWMAIGDAQNDVEEYLVYRNVCLSFELDRTERARLERCASLIEKSDEEELTVAQAVGRQLFFDPAGPTPLYGIRPLYAPKKMTSWNGEAVDPNDPAALVKILESNAAGCCWLREEWQALRAQLESTGFWQSHDRLKAIRLLGRQPIEANDDRRVATIFVASHALRPAGKTAFDDLLGDVYDDQQERYGKAVRERWPDLFRTREKAEWRQILLALADQNIERLNAKLEVHEQNADAQAERALAHLCFDHSPEGEALRNYLVKCTNGLFRGMANYRKYQAENKCRTSLGEGAVPPRPIYDLRGAKGDFPASSFGPAPEYPGGTIGGSGAACGVGRRGTNQDTSEAEGREAHERDGSALEADDAFGLGAGQDDRLERAGVVDPDGVEQHGDLMSGMHAIGENAPNEANFDGSMSDVEPQDSIQVTASSAARSGLDNALAQPGEGGTPEQGQAPGSASGTSNHQPPTPHSGDRARRESLPAAVSKREKGQPRCEQQRLAVERMVAEKLKAGNFSAREIIMSALTMPLPGGRDP